MAMESLLWFFTVSGGPSKVKLDIAVRDPADNESDDDLMSLLIYCAMINPGEGSDVFLPAAIAFRQLSTKQKAFLEQEC